MKGSIYGKMAIAVLYVTLVASCTPLSAVQGAANAMAPPWRFDTPQIAVFIDPPPIPAFTSWTADLVVQRRGTNDMVDLLWSIRFQRHGGNTLSFLSSFIATPAWRDLVARVGWNVVNPHGFFTSGQVHDFNLAAGAVLGRTACISMFRNPTSLEDTYNWTTRSVGDNRCGFGHYFDIGNTGIPGIRYQDRSALGWY